MRISNTYVNGEFIDDDITDSNLFPLINPANEDHYGDLVCSSIETVKNSINAAYENIQTMRDLSVDERIVILQRIYDEVKTNREEFGEKITLEMGAPKSLSSGPHINMGLDHIINTINVLKNYSFNQVCDGYEISKIPIGAVGLITPWNWPLNQLFTKVASAIAAGCPFVLKPSEYSSLSAKLVCEILHNSGLPKGSFNMVNGLGNLLGPVMTKSNQLSMISFTGSTKAGIDIQIKSAETIKRVSLELGGKSAHVIFDDVNYENAIPNAINQCFTNSGQSCSSPTRLLVPEKDIDLINDIAKRYSKTIKCIDPSSNDNGLGPVVNEKQYKNINQYIKEGMESDAVLVSDVITKDDENKKGYFIKPTIFTNVCNSSKLAQEEIFGPVLCIISYKDLDDALMKVNDSKYGLSSYITCKNIEDGKLFAQKIEAGQTIINKINRGSVPAPFGGFKMSGNGREHGIHGLEEYLEIKAII
tara:strand:- start:450 stop:1871 length:1422 start_codon:yes stop_codon:yes gene_type:complete